MDDNDLDDYKLNTTFHTDHVSHISYKSDRDRGLRKIEVKTRWYSKHELGAGTFGIVRLETSDTGEKRAVKAVRKTVAQRYGVDYRRELAALTVFSRAKFAQHEIFVQFLGWFEDPDYIFLAMEYLPHGDLNNFLSLNLSVSEIKKISSQLLNCLDIMHEKGFTHRDLKPQDIFIVQPGPRWWVKIGDFGISKRIRPDKSTQLKTATGTQGYEAPEIRHYITSTSDDSGSDEDVDTYTYAVDIWPLGCILYELVAHEVPFPTSKALKRYCIGRTPFPVGPLKHILDPDSVSLLQDFLVAKPPLRLTARTALNAKWLQDHNESSTQPALIRKPSFYTSPKSIDSQRLSQGSWVDYGSQKPNQNATSVNPEQRGEHTQPTVCLTPLSHPEVREESLWDAHYIDDPSRAKIVDPGRLTDQSPPQDEQEELSEAFGPKITEAITISKAKPASEDRRQSTRRSKPAVYTTPERNDSGQHHEASEEIAEQLNAVPTMTISTTTKDDKSVTTLPVRMPEPVVSSLKQHAKNEDRFVLPNSQYKGDITIRKYHAHFSGQPQATKAGSSSQNEFSSTPTYIKWWNKLRRKSTSESLNYESTATPGPEVFGDALSSRKSSSEGLNHDLKATPVPRVFGVALETSIRYASYGWARIAADGESNVEGYLPIIAVKVVEFIKGELKDHSKPQYNCTLAG